MKNNIIFTAKIWIVNARNATNNQKIVLKKVLWCFEVQIKGL